MFDLICDTPSCERVIVDDPDDFDGEAFCPQCHHSLRFEDRAFRHVWETVVTGNPNMR